METAVDVAGTPAANEAVIPAAVETPVTEAPAAPSLDSELEGIWSKHNPPRENGRFMSRTKVDQPPEPGTETKPEVVADQAAETVVEQPKAAIDAPISWSAEMKAKLATLPPEHADLIKYATQRDKEQGDAITRAGQQIKAFEPIRNVIEQHAETFRRNGLHPADGIERMMNIHDRLEAGPDQAAAVIREIAQAYRVDLSGQAVPNASPENGKIAELEARVAKAESFLTAQQRQQLASENAAVARSIADFAKDKPHFETVRNTMAGLMNADETLSLQDAYDMAIHANPTTRQSILADQQKASEDKRRADEAERVKSAKKAAGVNVKSSPGSTATARTLDDDLREIANRAYGSR